MKSATYEVRDRSSRSTAGATEAGIGISSISDGRGNARFAPSDSQSRSQAHRLLQGTGVRSALPHDVESRAVRGRREHGLETSSHRNAAVEALELGRDLALI